MISTFFPLKIIVFGSLHITSWNEWVNEPLLRFNVKIKIRSRGNGTIDDFYLRAKSKNGTDINIQPIFSNDKLTNLMKVGESYSKKEYGPFDAVFELPKAKLLAVNEKEWVRMHRFYLVLKVSYRNRWPITKRILVKRQKDATS